MHTLAELGSLSTDAGIVYVNKKCGHIRDNPMGAREAIVPPKGNRVSKRTLDQRHLCPETPASMQLNAVALLRYLQACGAVCGHARGLSGIGEHLQPCLHACVQRT
jgi:hypothetical protein